MDILPSPYTHIVGSVSDPKLVAEAMVGVDQVYHTATLHKPHVVTHSKADFLDTNITGTLTLLEAAARQNVSAFVFTSTTSVFGDALRPKPMNLRLGSLKKPSLWSKTSMGLLSLLPKICADCSPQPRSKHGGASHIALLSGRRR